MHPGSSRVVQWGEREAQMIEISSLGVRDGHPPFQCELSSALVYSGHGLTNREGLWTLYLPAISCLKPAPGGDRAASIVAMPTTFGSAERTPRPYVLVARVEGAQIAIWSFDLDGQHAPAVEFSWHCVIEGSFIH